MLEKWQKMLEDLKQESRGEAILKRMKNTLKQMKGELSQCYKIY